MQNDLLTAKIAILIPSCDKYSDVWPYFFTLLFKYWPEAKQYKIYLLSNHQVHTDNKVCTLTVGNEKSWSDNVSFALEKISEEYILVILEDFLLTAAVDNICLAELFGFMQEKNAGYLRLMANPAPKKSYRDNPKLGSILTGEEYRTSLQVAIWKKSLLQKILQSGESPWEFELNGSIRSNQLNDLFLSITKICKQPIPYFPNTIVRGLWVNEAVAFLRQEGFQDSLQRSIENKIVAVFRKNRLRTFLSKFCIKPIKILVTKIIKNNNSKSQTENFKHV